MDSRKFLNFVMNRWDLAMNILLYTAKHTESGERLKRSLERIASLQTLSDCGNLSELATYFQTPAPLPETVVLQASNRLDLQTFEAFRVRLEQVFFILVLPDADTATVASGHKLRPRFIVYQDSDFSEVVAVLERLDAKQGADPKGLLLPLA